MACALTQGYTVDCRDSLGGAKEIYLIELGNITSYTETAGVLTTITKDTGKAFWLYQQIKETSYGKATANGNSENGTLFFTHEVGMVLNKLQSTTRAEVLLLAKNLLVAVVKDNNGKYWLYGRENGLQLTTGESGTGTAMGDRNGYTLTFTGGEKEMEIEVDSTTAATLTTAGA